MSKSAERLLAFGFGVTFVSVLIVLAIKYPNPSTFQYEVFRIVLALAAGGVAAMIPGFVNVHVANWLRAGGALAVFVIVYFYSPAHLVGQSPSPAVTESLLSGRWSGRMKHVGIPDKRARLPDNNLILDLKPIDNGVRGTFLHTVVTSISASGSGALEGNKVFLKEVYFDIYNNDERHSYEYRGQINPEGDTIDGVWSGSDRDGHGTFEVHRIP